MEVSGVVGRQRGGAFGDKPSLISRQPFCAEGYRTQGRAEGSPPPAVARKAILDFDILPRLALAKKSMQESDLNSCQTPSNDADQL
jgi:hypothetical protein